MIGRFKKTVEAADPLFVGIAAHGGASSFIAYHGSDDPDIEDLESNYPGYIGSYGPGVYLAFDADTAEHYGQYVYTVRVDIAEPEIFSLDEESYISLDSYDSLSPGERIPPFSFIIENRYTGKIEKYTVCNEPYDLEQELIDEDDEDADDDKENLLGMYIDMDEIAGIVEHAGYEALFIDYPVRDDSREWVNDEILIFNPNRITILSVTDTEEQSHRTVGNKNIKSSLPSNYVSTVGAFDPFFGHSDPSFGIMTRPGFHTTGSFNIAVIYAQQKFESNIEEFTINEEYFTRYLSYPVVVTLDMTGLNPLTDYDVENILIPQISDIVTSTTDYSEFKELVDMMGSDFSIDYPIETANAVLCISEGYGFDNITGSFFSFMEDADPEYAEYIYKKIKYNKWDDELFKLAMSWMNQYRYTDIIGYERVLEVNYIKPFFPDLIEYDEEEKAEVVENYGFEVLSLDDIYNTFIVSQSVYHVSQIPENAVVQYHGTGYDEIVGALPEISEFFPIPPEPFNTAVPSDLFT